MSPTSPARRALALCATALLGCAALRRPPAGDAVLLATVLRLEETGAASPRWIVHCRVQQVLSGDLRRGRFAFRVFSPALSGLAVGQRIRIEAHAGPRGYLVDPLAGFTDGQSSPSFAPSASSRE